MPLARTDQNVAPEDRLVGHTRQVDCQPASGIRRREGPVVALQTSDPYPVRARRNQQVVADGDLASAQGAGDHGARAANRERTIDPQARSTPVCGGGNTFHQPIQSGRQGIDAPAVGHVDEYGLRLGQKCPINVLAHFESGQFEDLIVHETNFGQSHHAVGNAEELENPQMLLGLRHPPLRGGDDKEAGIDLADAGKHVLEKPPMPRHVHKADLAARFERGRCKPQIDCHPPGLLFLPAIGVGTGEGPDKCGLAVVNVAGGRNYPHLLSRRRLRPGLSPARGPDPGRPCAGRKWCVRPPPGPVSAGWRREVRR